MIPYIGDLSANDALLLAKLAGKAKRILEFGAGASTQIFANYSLPGTELFSVETQEFWIARTEKNLERLEIRKPVRFIHWNLQENPLQEIEGVFDLIFVDGVDALRGLFMLAAWEKLPIGGIIATHDTRRHADFVRVNHFLAENWLEVESLQINVDDSNITVLKRGPLRQYVDWNAAESKLAWQHGVGEPPTLATS
jgi:predicted O-methyltransferase YrrM